MKNILITGANSYVGTSFESWICQYGDGYKVDTIDVRNNSWRQQSFRGYDVVLNVAGIVHLNSKKIDEDLYYKVNKDLAIEIAEKAKSECVNQFIQMSTMAIYGLEGRIDEEVIIDENTEFNPTSTYGKSKLLAEEELNRLNCLNFKVVILRPPMIYGPNCPGNYARLKKLALKTPIFPMVENKRSMLHIDKLCQYIKEYVDYEINGIFMPQDDEYTNTSMLVKRLAEENGRRIYLSEAIGLVIKLIGKRFNIINKVFGNLIYKR